ncbi:hypothetical protein D3C77_672740 [compost metagenome]
MDTLSKSDRLPSRAADFAFSSHPKARMKNTANSSLVTVLFGANVSAETPCAIPELTNAPT